MENGEYFKISHFLSRALCFSCLAVWQIIDNKTPRGLKEIVGFRVEEHFCIAHKVHSRHFGQRASLPSS